MASKILGKSKEELVALDPESINTLLSKEELIHIATILDAYWQYDYEAVKEGRTGLHAELKSLLHSDGFFNSGILLKHENIRMIIANQIVLRLGQRQVFKCKWVAGIPDGATELGADVAKIMSAKNAEMRKVDGKVVLSSSIDNDNLLLVEDFCTKGRAFVEAVLAIKKKQPKAKILPYAPVIINRGGLREIIVEGVGNGKFQIVSAAEYQVNDWSPAECPLCKMGSKPIKPKATPENWTAITTSQL